MKNYHHERSYLHMFLARSLQAKYPTQPTALSDLLEKKINLFLQSNLAGPPKIKTQLNIANCFVSDLR